MLRFTWNVLQLSNPVSDMVKKIAATSPTDTKSALTPTEEKNIIGLIENYVARAEEDDSNPLKNLMFQQALTSFTTSFSQVGRYAGDTGCFIIENIPGDGGG